MRSKEVYAILNVHLSPMLKAAGFKKLKPLLSWSRPHRDQHLVMWCQVSQSGWDLYSGSQFVVEYQRSKEPVVGSVTTPRWRFAALLDAGAREELRAIQNRVIASLPRPPPEYYLQLPGQVRDWYLDRFRNVHEPYSEGQDVWLRYRSGPDVMEWAEFVGRRFLACLEEFERRTKPS